MTPLIIAIVGCAVFACVLAWAACIVAGHYDEVNELTDEHANALGIGAGEVFNHATPNTFREQHDHA